MARMFPERAREGMPDSERLIHERLRVGLDDGFVVFHSVAWHGRGRKPDGEIDFLVAHPTLGLLVIEVKGGRLGTDPASGEWFSRDRYGDIHKIKDPFEQSLTAKHEFISDVREDHRWPAGRRCQIGYAVAMPDVVLGADRPPRAKPEISFDRSDIHEPGQRVVACLRYWCEVEPAAPPGRDGVEALLEMYGRARSYRIPLAEMLAEDERQIIELTEQQFRLLDLLDRQRRVAIAGCAGSGKTLLAFEKARRLAASGRKVLLTCFNASLAGHLNESVDVPRGLTVRHFHGFASDMVRAAAIDPPAEARAGDEYVEWLPDGLLDALTGNPARFDAIVVDEAQDFEMDWFDVLESWLNEGSRGHFYAFYDDNQSIYRTAAIPDWLGEPYPLTIDCRNTDQIGAMVRALHLGSRFDLSGVDGRPVVFFAYKGDASLEQSVRRLSEALGQLRNAGADPARVVVLDTRREASVYRRRDYGDWRLYSDTDPDGNVFFSTVHAFKGQESQVVVLTGLERVDGGIDTANRQLLELAYVGCSRATTQLAIVSNQAVAGWLKGLASGDGLAQ